MKPEEKTKENIYKELYKFTIETEKRKAGSYSYITRSIILTIPLIATLVSLFITLSNPEGVKYVEKASLKEMMHKTIKNGGELSSIKHIYNTRIIENVSIFKKDRNKQYYVEDYPLSGILNDLLVDYLQNSNKDSIYFEALRHIISENEKHNPFDRLDENQRYIFVSIQEKSDSIYTKISPDLIKIADELNNKNQLVNLYLNKSETSFILSIIALIITFILSGYQIYQNHYNNNSIQNYIKKISIGEKNKEKVES